MPYQALSTAVETEARTVLVIPGVDLVLGTVTLFVNGGLSRFRHHEAPLIAQALAQAVRPSRWCDSSRTLTVTVAALGRTSGLERHFRFGEDGPA